MQRSAVPAAGDYLAFLVAMPLLFAIWATAIGMAPARNAGFVMALPYIAIQVTAAWWANAVGSQVVAWMTRRKPLPRWLALVLGFVLVCLPLGIFYKGQTLIFQQLLPALQLSTSAYEVEWSLDYAARFCRYSLPFLPVWIAAVYGYQILRGVQWFSPSAAAESAMPVPVSASHRPATLETHRPTAPEVLPFVAAGRLPADAQVWAVKAEEHYIKLWSDHGVDLVRYRFRDAIKDLASRDGTQVHRSWWIDWSAVVSSRSRGRSLELVLRNGLSIPVSLAHKAEAGRRTAKKQGWSRPRQNDSDTSRLEAEAHSTPLTRPLC
ncbi:MAG: LytTR family transcriptional regulator DNA-binding domain-containing protein [Gammaproteobacteria bacterium]